MLILLSEMFKRRREIGCWPAAVIANGGFTPLIRVDFVQNGRRKSIQGWPLFVGYRKKLGLLILVAGCVKVMTVDRTRYFKDGQSVACHQQRHPTEDNPRPTFQPKIELVLRIAE